MTRNELYPIFLKLHQLNVLIVGGGNVGLEKLSFLLKSSPNANVEIVAPHFLPEIEVLVEKHNLKMTKKKFKKKMLKKRHMVIACTDDLLVNKRIYDLAAGVKSVHIPYKGSAQAHLDIIAGNVQIMFDTTSSAMGQIKAGKFKPLAVTTAQRTSELPNVPTLAEAGVPGFEMSTWYGLFVTTGTPPDVVVKLQTELARIIKLPDVQIKLKGLGGESGNLSPEEFTKLNRQEFERFGKLIKLANIKM